MYRLSCKLGLALGVLSLIGCTDSEPTRQSTDYVSAYAGLDGAAPIVRESTGAARDAGQARSDTSVLALADAGDAASGAPSGTVDGAVDAATSSAARDAGDASLADAGSALAMVDAGAQRARAITIRFKAVVGATSMSCGQTYSGVGNHGTTAYARDFRFFVQDLRLINAAGKDVPVKLDVRPPFQEQGVSLIDFETGEDGCEGTSELNTEITGTVPPDDYRGIAFSNGVPEALNHGNPDTAPAPLRARGMNVSQLSGYRFLRAELVQFDAPAELTGSAELHVNSTECSGDVQSGRARCAKANRVEVRLLGFDPGKNILVADLGQLFTDVDLEAITVCHSELDLCDPLFERLGIDYASGTPAGAQQLYRVGP